MPNCKSCGAQLVWARTKSGAAMPLDVQAVPGVKPNILYSKGVAHVVQPGNGTYTSHFATCPQAKEHRKPRDAS